MDLYIPDGIKTISKVLSKSGYQCYLVGGAIRNQLLGKDAKDFDLTTNAEPEIVISLFKRVIPTGIKHGTVTILINRDSFEITTYRIDGKYTDGRRPDKIEFTPSIEEDLIRRDFTINSIAYNIETDQILDINFGVNDLNSRLIKAIGDPQKRFSEDALRLVRACRFASQLNFDIEENTYKAMTESNYQLADVSKERISEELMKILNSNLPSIAFVHFYKTGMMQILFPDLDLIAKENKRLFYSALKDMDNIQGENYLKMARLLSIIPKEKQFPILKDLKLPNKYINSTLHILRFISINIWSIKEGYELRSLLSKIRREYIDDLMDLLGALDKIDEKGFNEFKKLITDELNRNNPLTIKELDINGSDLIKSGYKPGPDIGEKLGHLLECALHNPSINEKDKLLKLI